MSFSFWSYFVRRDDSRFEQTKPVSVGDSLALANNAAHLADESGQEFVNWALPTGYMVGSGDIGDTTWKLMERYGPFDLTMRADGKPFEFRVRTTMATSGGGGTGYIRIAVGPPSGTDLDARASAAPDNVAQFTATSTSETTASRVITIPASKIPMLIQNVSTYAGDGTRTGVLRPQVVVDVWFRAGTTTQNNPRLYELYVAEYVGL